ncbi:MAG: permease, partial [Prochlorococcaceae cyanobacterium ETNP1_MAG_9]|nr:permease [Prochlorococcaceae cyanobacterium ETNP1_MAG_9]
MSSRIVMAVINFGVPISVMGLLLQAGLDWSLLEAAFLAVLAIGVMILLLRTIPKVKQLMSRPTLQLASSFGNTGYFGIPVALALLPSKALTMSIGYDLGATLLIWSLGPPFWAERVKNAAPLSPSVLTQALLANPAAKGLIGALIVQLTPWEQEIAIALWGPSKCVTIFGLLVVGMRIGSLWPFDQSIFI